MAHKANKRPKPISVDEREEQQETQTMIRKIRVIYSDPHATDSSSDDSEKKNIQEIIFHRVFNPKRTKFTCLSCIQNLNTDCFRDSNPKLCVCRKPRKLYRGVRQRKLGRWSAEIRDPIKKCNVLLGTYNTAEEAYKVYLSKKAEFKAQKKLMAKKEGYQNQPISSPTSVLKEEISVSSNDEREGISGIAMEGFVKEEVKNDEGLVVGQCLTIQGGQEVNFGFGFGSMIIDNYGFLLGEYSKLDDLSICQIEDDNEGNYVY